MCSRLRALPDKTVADNVAFGLRARKQAESAIKLKVERRWSVSASAIWAPAIRPRSPAASASAWRWRAPSSSSRRCC
jgi:ABC-type sugar transport system ATPase subunit